MKRIAPFELAVYAITSLLYWLIVYYLVRLAPVLACGLGPDSPDDCDGTATRWTIGATALAFYAFLVFVTVRTTRDDSDA